MTPTYAARFSSEPNGLANEHHRAPVRQELTLKDEHRLTPLGHTLLGTVCELMGWAVTHADEIDAARAAYDQKLVSDPALPR